MSWYVTEIDSVGRRIVVKGWDASLGARKDRSVQTRVGRAVDGLPWYNAKWVRGKSLTCLGKGFSKPNPGETLEIEEVAFRNIRVDGHEKRDFACLPGLEP